MYLKSLASNGCKAPQASKAKCRRPSVCLGSVRYLFPPSVRSEVRTETTLAPAQNSRRLADQKESFSAFLH